MILRAAVGSPYGVSVVVGTGTITLGMSNHASHRAAGWGPAFRDPGCGYDIGQRGLAAAAASVDGRGPRSALEEAIAVACRVDSMLQAMQWAYKEPHSWSRIASLAPAVIQCARGGDGPACDLLQECAVELVKSVKAVWSRVAEHDCSALPLALSGGLLDDENNAAYRTMVIEELQRELPVQDILMCASRPLQAWRVLTTKSKQVFWVFDDLYILTSWCDHTTLMLKSPD